MTTALRLDYQPYRPFPGVGWLLLVLILPVVLIAGRHYVDLNDQAAVLESKARRIGSPAQQDVGRPPVRSAADRTPEVKRANEVLRKLTVHWDELFVGLESAAVEKVTLLVLTPDLEKHTVKINGEADNFATLMDYIATLEDQNVFGAVHLQSHQVQLLDPQKPVRFSLLAYWREQP